MLQQVDDAVIEGCKQPNQVSVQEEEGRGYDSVVQVLGMSIKEEERIEDLLHDWKGL